MTKEERYQQLKHDMVKNWILSLPESTMSDLAAKAFVVKQEGRRNVIFISGHSLRASLLDVLDGKELDVVWMAKPMEEAI